MRSNHFTNFFQDISDIPAGIQNSYVDFKEEFFYVTSTGSPNYEIFATDTKTEVSVSGVNTSKILDSTNHRFYDGENIYFIPTDAQALE